jgi:hypothetical protein
LLTVCFLFAVEERACIRGLRHDAGLLVDHVCITQLHSHWERSRLVSHLVIYVSLRFSAVLVRLLRPAGIEVVTRIAGLLLAAIAIQLVAGAVASLVRGYTG